MKNSILKEEKRILMEQVRCLRRGEEPPLGLPSFDLDELSDDDLDDKFHSLRKYKETKTRNRSVSRKLLILCFCIVFIEAWTKLAKR